MGKALLERLGRQRPIDPSKRGYHIVYREDEVNHCPGCGRSNWFIGRVSAECAFCATALPLTESSTQVAGGYIAHRRYKPQAWEQFAAA